MTDRDDTAHYDHPTGGWGSVRGMTETILRERARPGVLRTLARQNKPGGFQCVGCAWTKPAEYHPFEFCENGAKATAWELTSLRAGPGVFAKHTLTELRTWKDHDLEQTGRLTHPLRYDRATDKYVPVSWDEAIADIGQELKALDPKTTVFYASGRASLETSYLWALFARAYGHNNLPDSSNMCHETTSVALKATIGSPVGTVIFDDFSKCDAIFFFGQNTGSNSPRFLHPLQEAVKRGCRIVTFNPVKERGLEEFTNPQSPVEMLTGKSTTISQQYLQVRPGGDVAAMIGIAKHVLAAEDRKWREEQQHVLDVDFIAQHTADFDAYKAKVDATSWDEIETASGLTRRDIERAAQVFVEAEKIIGIYGMGLTQHVGGYDNVGNFLNLLLMRGMIGREGTGISPVRGHSNVQGQRTVGITEKPELVPYDRLKALYDFDPPTEEGMNTVAMCKALLAGEVTANLSLGGNLLRAVPDRERVSEAWSKQRLTVQIATRLNYSHLVPGEVAYLLPCLGRSEEDRQAGGPQTVTMEDSLSHIHGSVGKERPAAPTLRSELAIVCALAKATLAPHPRFHWDRWTGDYGLVRDLIEATYPEEFHDFSARMFTPGGFYRGNSARERVWKTKSGKAEFTTSDGLNTTGFADAPGRYRLITMRSNDQFNTTIYGYSDRLRGIEGTRDVLLISPEDIAQAGLHEGEIITLLGDADDGVAREVAGLAVTPFRLPRGSVGAYYPEVNPLVPVGHHDRASKTPAYKTVPVRIRRADGTITGVDIG